ncbi:ion transporter [Natronogracilivirga saccharolytica]|uniref:Ion transporter n=1 Tax=Natronogracilivirga saccharolytica TaxID=2812953 RepID=A0A8J7S4E4_9BACT|nr:ion transporter [Natronogracilivirga saccharolytica]MBP3191773.1 ion transporter [Natronogracilivirga saccharolytica]
MSSFSELSRKIAESSWFNQFILIVILAAGVVVGIQTYGEKVADYKELLWTLDQIILFIFLVEVIIKMSAEGNKPLRYFNDPWNVFDFTIVTVCYLALLFPEVEGAFVAVFRLARVMRVFRIVRTIPKLRLLVNTLLKSIPSIGYIGILLSVIFYIYATMGVFLFRENDPVHFGNLQLSLLSLFRVVTLEDWTNIMYINMYGCDHAIWGYGEENGCTDPQAFGFGAALYFVTFVLIGTMIVLNLFIGVIMNSMDEAKRDARDEAERAIGLRERSLQEELSRVSGELDEMKQRIDTLARRHSVTKDTKDGPDRHRS